MPLPLIGITISRRSSPEGIPLLRTPEAYAQAVAQAGAAPCLIPQGLSEEACREMLSRLDGVLFSGGGDIDPQFYGEQSDPVLRDVDPDRDRLEFQLLHDTIQEGMPFLGICRGIQTVNVALGGSLYLDIPKQLPNAVEHDFYPGWPRQHLAHPVQVEPSSRLAKIVGGGSLQVNSLHHQGIRQLAPGLRAVAHAPDGLIEAVELPDHPFGFAVQWHPEALTAHPPMQALFRAFVQATAP